MSKQVIEAIERSKVIVIVRRVYGETLLNIASALVDAGVELMEITFDQSDPDCLTKTGDSIRMLAEHFAGRLLPCAGTVLNTEQVDAAIAAGAKYIISPNTNADVIRYTKQKGLVSIPGAMTPSEILAAHDYGADFIKIFPASELGLKYIKDIKGPISHVKLVATGGVNENNFEDFLKVGYAGAGIGGRLTDKEQIAAGNFAELGRRAKVLLDIAKKY